MSANAQRILPGRLRFYVPFRDLSPDQLIPLAGRLELREAEARQRVAEFPLEETREALFLVEGEVSLPGPDGQPRRVMAGSEAARSPIGADAPRPCAITALSRVRYFRVAHALLDALQARTESSAVPDQAPRAQVPLYREFELALRANRVVLPSLPQVAHRIRLATQDDSLDLQRIARLVAGDPAVAAKLVKVANSPLYRGAAQVARIADAIVRLGLHTTRELVVCFTLRDLFRVDTPLLRTYMASLWHHALDVAALAFVLARRTGRLDAEQALLGGLLHDIGALPIIHYAAKAGERDWSPDEIDGAIARMRGDLGGMILEHWHFPDDDVAAARHAETWAYDHGGAPGAVDLVIAAHWQLRAVSAAGTPLPVAATVPALTRLGLEVDDGTGCLRLLEGAEATLQEARALFAP